MAVGHGFHQHARTEPTRVAAREDPGAVFLRSRRFENSARALPNVLVAAQEREIRLCPMASTTVSAGNHFFRVAEGRIEATFSSNTETQARTLSL